MHVDSFQTPDFTLAMLHQADVKLKRCQWQHVNAGKDGEVTTKGKDECSWHVNKEKAVAQRQPSTDDVFKQQQNLFPGSTSTRISGASPSGTGGRFQTAPTR